jgi:SAM-dependent methyltransferase
MSIPSWLEELLGMEIPADGAHFTANGVRLVREGDILRAENILSPSQIQTRDTFGYKWKRRDTFEGAVSENMHRWLIEKYGRVWEAAWLKDYGDYPILLDAGCGGGMSGLELWGPVLPRLRYVGVDISAAVDVAHDRFSERGMEGVFIQSDLQEIPFPEESVDIVFSEGVLHHTDDTRAALGNVCRYLRLGGRILFYVYKEKGPIREFSDDYLRGRLQSMTPDEAWEALLPLTKLGKVLGELNLEIEVPEDINLLDIPAGKTDIQRLFYWHIFKAFYRPDMTLDELNHVNFDWYTPRNAYRQTPEQVRTWCSEMALEIEHEHIEAAGISIIARKEGGL